MQFLPGNSVMYNFSGHMKDERNMDSLTFMLVCLFLIRLSENIYIGADLYQPHIAGENSDIGSVVKSRIG